MWIFMENNRNLHQEPSADNIRTTDFQSSESVELATPDQHSDRSQTRLSHSEPNTQLKVEAKTEPENEPEINKSATRFAAIADFLLRLIAYYPWLPITALLLVFFGSGMLALYSLGIVSDPNEKAQSEAENPPVNIVEPITPPSPNQNANPIPIWMVLAIAISCAGGCILILRMIRPSRKTNSAIAKPVNRYQARVAQRQQQPFSGQKTSGQPFSAQQTYLPHNSVRQIPKAAAQKPVKVPKTSSFVVPPQPTNPSLQRRSFIVNQPTYLNKPEQTRINPAPIKSKSFVKSVPPILIQSPQHIDESLADSLDLRKQSPLSSILRRY